MNQNSQTPPEFQKKKNSINPKYIAGAAAFVVAAGACGFGGAMLANNMTGPSGVTINQQSGNSSTAAINDVSDIAAKCGPTGSCFKRRIVTTTIHHTRCWIRCDHE